MSSGVVEPFGAGTFCEQRAMRTAQSEIEIGTRTTVMCLTSTSCTADGFAPPRCRRFRRLRPHRAPCGNERVVNSAQECANTHSAAERGQATAGPEDQQQQQRAERDRCRADQCLLRARCDCLNRCHLFNASYESKRTPRKRLHALNCWEHCRPPARRSMIARRSLLRIAGAGADCLCSTNRREAQLQSNNVNSEQMEEIKGTCAAAEQHHVSRLAGAIRHARASLQCMASA